MIIVARRLLLCQQQGATFFFTLPLHKILALSVISRSKGRLLAQRTG